MLPSPFPVATVQEMAIMIPVRCLHRQFLASLPCGHTPSRIRPLATKVSENAEDATRLDITLCCTGAANNLTVYLDDMVLFAGSGKEVHQVFGQAAGKFINTVNDGIKVDPITETIRKPANFSFETADFWIKSPSGDVHVAKQGEDPHGIVVPGNWRWPREFQCIPQTIILRSGTRPAMAIL